VSSLFPISPRFQPIDAWTVASEVCRNLVLYDDIGHNPFRDLIAMSHHHPALLHIIIANSALHMSNAAHKCPTSTTSGSASPSGRLASKTSNPELSKFLVDAFKAKQRALELLRRDMLVFDAANIDVTLAVILLFIDFDLICSGTGSWRCHIRGARAIIGTLCEPHMLTLTSTSELRRCLVSNCVVYVSKPFCEVG
jgi:hypothetical protein